MRTYASRWGRHRSEVAWRPVMTLLTSSALVLALVTTIVTTMAGEAGAENDPDRPWASVEIDTGYVENVLGCTTAVCGDPASFFRQDYERRGLLLLDLTTMDLEQRPGPGWWYVDGTFVRDSFARNVSARADILSVHLSWSTGGLGLDSTGATFVVDVQPTGQRFTVSDSRLTIDPLEADVLHTFTVTATLADGSTVTGPVVTATPQPDPDPECTDHSVARECRSATNWAVVHPTTGMVENVIVCTTSQCGTDGEWGGVMPADTFWPGHRLIELTGPAGIGWQYVDGTFVDVRPVDDGLSDSEPSTPAPTEDVRTWAVVEDSTGMVLNTIVWDGEAAYDPGPGVTLVELDGRAGIGWQYVDGTFVDVRPVEDDLLGAPSTSSGSAPNGGAVTTDLATTELRAPLPVLPEGQDWGADGLPNVGSLEDYAPIAG